MSHIKNEKKIQNIINKNNLTSIRSDTENSNNFRNIINLKMRRINNKANNQNNSDKIQFELKKLLGDLHGSKFINDKISKEKISKTKLTPFQKILRENEKVKRALSIKKNSMLNHRHLEYIINLSNLTNKKFKKPNIKNFNNKEERFLHKSFLEISKNQNNFNRTNYTNFIAKAMKLPISRNIPSYKEVDKDRALINQNNNINNILSINSKKIVIDCNSKSKINKLNIKNNYNNSNHSKTFSKINLKIPITKKNRNITISINDFIRTNTERNKDNIGVLNHFIEPKIYNYLYKKEKSKKIIKETKNNRTYTSFLINKNKNTEKKHENYIT